MQHKDANISCNYRKFICQPIYVKRYEIRERNTIISYYHYRFDMNLGKVFCDICRIPCTCPVFVAKLDQYWIYNFAPSSKPRYACVENCYYTKVLEHYNYWNIM